LPVASGRREAEGTRTAGQPMQTNRNADITAPSPSPSV